MNPLLVVLPYHPGDLELAKKLLVWIAELGSCKPHSLLLCADSKIPQDQMRELMDIARPNFHRVTTMIVTVPTASNDMRVWAPNVMFLAAARQVHTNYKHDFLWLEPDAIPVHPGWLDDIAIEFARCPKRYLGSIIHQDNQPGLPADYLNGVAVYPNDAIELFDRITSIKTSEHAFDIGSAKYVVPKALNTPLIRHYYGTKEMPPVFVEAKAPDSPKNHVTLDFVGEEAAIFHRSKDGNLIELLRKRGVKYKPERDIDLPAVRASGKLIAAEVTENGANQTSPELEPDDGKKSPGAPTPARTPAANRRQTQPA